jgi:hypothetical protein
MLKINAPIRDNQSATRFFVPGMSYVHRERLPEYSPANYPRNLRLLDPQQVVMVRLQNERFAVRIVMYPEANRICFLHIGPHFLAVSENFLLAQPMGSNLSLPSSPVRTWQRIAHTATSDDDDDDGPPPLSDVADLPPRLIRLRPDSPELTLLSPEVSDEDDILDPSTPSSKKALSLSISSTPVGC